MTIKQAIEELDNENIRSYLTDKDKSYLDDAKNNLVSLQTSCERARFPTNKVSMSPLDAVFNEENAPTDKSSKSELDSDKDYSQWAQNVIRAVDEICQNTFSHLDKNTNKKVVWLGVLVSIALTLVGAIIMWLVSGMDNGVDITSFWIERFSDFVSVLPIGTMGGSAVAAGNAIKYRKNERASSHKILIGAFIAIFVLCAVCIGLVWVFMFNGVAERYLGKDVAAWIYVLTQAAGFIAMLLITIFLGMTAFGSKPEEKHSEAKESEE